MARPHFMKQLLMGDSDLAGKQIEKEIGNSLYSNLVTPYVFPTRESFKRELRQEVLAEMRNVEGLFPDERVILFTKGGVGDDFQDTLIPFLNETTLSFSHPLYVVIVCGSENETYKKLESYFKKTPSHPQMRFKLYGKLEEQQIACYGQLA